MQTFKTNLLVIVFYEFSIMYMLLQTSMQEEKNWTSCCSEFSNLQVLLFSTSPYSPRDLAIFKMRPIF